MNKSGFLSCLCGSERALLPRLLGNEFLSCLCGSEPNNYLAGNLFIFLSCLCGSEPRMIKFVPIFQFLSCLCGSELILKTFKTSRDALYRRFNIIYPFLKHIPLTN